MQRCNATLVPHAVRVARVASHLVAVPAKGKTRSRAGLASGIACCNFCHREALVAAIRGARVDPVAWRLPPLADDRRPASPRSHAATAADSRVADGRSAADRRPEARGRARAGARATAATRTGRRRAMSATPATPGRDGNEARKEARETPPGLVWTSDPARRAQRRRAPLPEAPGARLLACPSGCAGLSPPSILDLPVGRFCRRGRARKTRRRRNEWRHPWKTASSSSAMTPASAPWR